MAKTTELLIPAERIERAILLIRGEEVLLDRDLAELYGVGTRVLVQSVKRNLHRFPADFMFQLSKEEFENWRSQFVMSNPGSKMGLRRRPYAFTEQGITNTIVPGQLDIFSNVAGGQFTNRPNTILVDSEELESGDAMSDEFKKIAAREIDEFKADYRRRFPGSDPDKLTDEDLLREVLNTVGKPGKLGENVKCVVSVSMLTEGWDANTVTHILGVRAFGTQLLCEQVVGRGLRRMSYHPESSTLALPNGTTATLESFPIEYAEVYGVPVA